MSWCLIILMVAGHVITMNQEIEYGFKVEDYAKIEKYGVATQGSTAYGGVPSRAIDGNIDGRWKSGTCTHTKEGSNSTWWKLSFFVQFKVNFIVLWNRNQDGQSFAKRIDQTKIYMENDLCATLEYEDGLNPYVVNCGAPLVKEIIIVGKHILTLCEVEVFSENPPVNIAKYGTASQSTVSWGGFANLAIDGDTSGFYFDPFGAAKCTHTYRGQCTERKPEWWKLEFSTEVQVDWINVWNRDFNGKNLAKRIDGLEVYADNTLCGVIKYIEGKRPYSMKCGSIMTRNITFELRRGDSCIITLCEVEVYTRSPPVICTVPTVPNGILRPIQVIKGSVATLECRKKFKTRGKWNFVCLNGMFGMEDGFPECVPINETDCVVVVEGGFLKKKCQDSSRRTFKCVNSDTMYDVIEAHDGTAAFSKICSADDMFYQPCGFNKYLGETTHELICGKFICQTAAENRSQDCAPGIQQHSTCQNLEGRDIKICPDESENSKRCDFICDDRHCKDEAQCNGFIYGKYCPGKYMPILALIHLGDINHITCPEVYNPYPGDKEKFLAEYDGPVCQHVQGDQTFTMPLFNFTRCGPFQYDLSAVANTQVWWVTSTKVLFCSDLMDQTNCTDPARIALFCKSKGFRSGVSKLAICHGFNHIKICDDGIENDCKQLTPLCFIHKHKMCDGKADCENHTDETNYDCKEMAELKCVRILGNQSLPIPLAWLGDGITDCVSGIDEDPVWPTCDRMCDMIDTCGNENKVCKIASNKPDLFTVMFKETESKSIVAPVCFRGLENLEELSSRCSKSYFQFPPTSIYGMNHSKEILMPSHQQNCDNFFGEMYLFASCSGRCKASQCPLSRSLKYDSCPGQYLDRIYTIANMDYLTFVTPSGRSFHNDYFICRNSRCVDFQRICDLVDDCGDGSDEEMCTNQLRCNTSGSTRIPKWQICDGTINCKEMTDECNEICGKEIIQGIPLKISAWVMGCFAILFNCYSCIQSARTLKFTKTLTGLLNKILIMFVGIGDFFVGGYLFAIAVIDTMYGSLYCFEQYQWLSSTYCSALGIVSTIGSQISLFSMTCLSITRLYGIINSMSFASSMSLTGYMQVLLILIAIIGASVGIAVAPLLPLFEDFFVNGLTYGHENPLFIGSTDKKVHIQIIQAYYGRSRGDRHSALSWRKITKLINSMFTSLYGGFERRKVDFYGNDGVCLFKYFVGDEDPQKIFSWSVLAINLICFIIISMSYFIINVKTVKSGKFVNNQQVYDRNKAMQRKISLIIATDFLCWVPFVIICCLHTLSVLDATPWYALFSLVVLPINSVLNPLLYDATLMTKVFRLMRSVGRLTPHSLSLLRQIRRNQELEGEDHQQNVANANVGRNSLEMSNLVGNCKSRDNAVSEEEV
ncbi:hypothetical protein ACHWQZ_G007220 [Mnemiopsis leidyi]